MRFGNIAFMCGLPRIFQLLVLGLVCLPARLHAISEQYTRVFQLPPGLAFCCGDEPPPNMPQPKLLPAGKDGRDPPPFETAQKALEFYDITFPEGATAAFDPETRVLVVRNTKVNLELVEVLVSEVYNQPRGTIASMITVVEGPAEMIRQADAAASRKPDAGEELTMLLGYAKNPGANVRVIGDAFVETTPHLKATTRVVREHAKAGDLRLNAGGKAAATIGTGLGAGFQVELETELDSNDVTFDTSLTLALQPHPPGERQMRVSEPRGGGMAEFPVVDVHEFKFVTSLTASTGATRLVGVAKPVGAAEPRQGMLWAVFVTQGVRRIRPAPLDIPPGSESWAEQPGLPMNLHTASLRVPEGMVNILMERPQPVPAWMDKPKDDSLPQVEGATMKQEGDVLHVVNTSGNIGRIAVLAQRILQSCTKGISISYHTVEAPAALVRDLVRHHLALPEDSGILASLLAAADAGKGRVVHSALLHASGRIPVVFESATDHAFLGEFNMAAQGQGAPHVIFQRRPAGLLLSLDPKLEDDQQTIGMKVLHELHFGPPRARRLQLHDAASKQPYELPVAEFDVAKTSTSLSLLKGGTKLISLHQPIAEKGSGAVGQDVLWATFLRCDVVPQLLPQVPTVEEKPPESLKDDGHLETQSFTVPPDFLSSGPGARRVTAKEILMAQGIPFPEGADAVYERGTRLMSVRNTRTNLAMVAEFVKVITTPPRKNFTFNVRVLEGPGALLRQISAEAAPHSSHAAEVEKLLAALKAGTLRETGSARLQGHSGQASTTEQGTQHQHLTSITLGENGAATFDTATRFSGLRLKMEPWVVADGYMLGVSLNGEFQSAPPTRHDEQMVDAHGRKLIFPLTDFHSTKVESHFYCAPGSARIAALWKPAFEKKDVLQVLVVTVHAHLGYK